MGVGCQCILPEPATLSQSICPPQISGGCFSLAQKKFNHSESWHETSSGCFSSFWLSRILDFLDADHVPFKPASVSNFLQFSCTALTNDLSYTYYPMPLSNAQWNLRSSHLSIVILFQSLQMKENIYLASHTCCREIHPMFCLSMHIYICGGIFPSSLKVRVLNTMSPIGGVFFLFRKILFLNLDFMVMLVSSARGSRNTIQLLQLSMCCHLYFRHDFRVQVIAVMHKSVSLHVKAQIMLYCGCSLIDLIMAKLLLRTKKKKDGSICIYFVYPAGLW